MTATHRHSAPPERSALARACLWLAALLLVAAALTGGSGDVRRPVALQDGAVLQRVAFDLAVLRQSEAPSVQRRMTADDRADGSGGPDVADAAATLPALSADRSAGAATTGAPVRPDDRRRLPEARAPPA
ncbi:hypothetical protein [Phreatobacter sp.]|uniref:hypothetical protein n=1 Tax=Phreatobacter sp. TaxID=1966341 RepID=UPI0025FE2EA2|nr:hypothetical protein [Phreatobacter sp.]